MSIIKNLFRAINKLFLTIHGWIFFLRDKLNERELLKKALYTLLLLAIFRMAATIIMPGVTLNDDLFSSEESSFLGIMDMLGGGALSNFSIVALGISPYITASIIMTLLQSEAFPPIHRLSKSGPAGKRKISYITIALTLMFAWLQAVTIILSFGSNIIFSVPGNTLFWTWFGMPLILMAGSLFVLFLGNQITNKGIGNGTSLIIFSGIVVKLPEQFIDAYNSFIDSSGATAFFVGFMQFLLYVILFLGLLWIVAYLYKAERHVPIQQTGAGLTQDVKQMSKLPIKLNPAGVMPIIFALTITVLPLTLIQFLDDHSLFKAWMVENWGLTKPIGLLVFVLLTFAFSIVMALVTFNPEEVSRNFKKGGTFIPGVKPGIETENYLTNIILRLSFFSAFYLSFVSVIEYVQQIMGLSPTSSFGGTGVIILVSVAIETIEQLKAREQTVKISKAKQRAAETLTPKESESSSGGLLW